ncbi:MAG TPA: Bax inhibitor-1/YccA family protein [Pararhizobium sp.]|uniref:Bax inhibitor-1/YccA family protein n=1 Tax=Pararhizobium sp. TaxID=1977563 RepID=UPI002C8B7F83|nr:Bax inhibitor-1/YccA family protein [Pararhizobium sp.]HTO29856.1 Bax inhibitor-1/YccA family protein [Pararhizobium sp.]
MAEYDRQTLNARAGSAVAIDEGLRSYMLRVYNYMGLGLVVTGLVAWYVSTLVAPQGSLIDASGSFATAFGAALYGSPLQWVVMLAPLGFVLVLSFGINKLSPVATQALFWVFAAVMGLSLSSIFAVYTGGSIAKVFFISAAMFGAMSLYGYTTKRDLTNIGSFLIMGLFGLIIASIVNIFLQSSALDFAVSAIGVLIFAGLTAYDTQKIKEMYYEADSTEAAGRKAIMGALTLYLDFINLFLFMLRFLGNRE